MRLRIVRIVLQTAVTAILLSLFLFAWRGFPFLQNVSFFQLIPSLLRFVEDYNIIPLLVVIGILSGTFLFGRFYCGILCPLGAAQDGLFFLSGRMKRQKMGYKQGHPWVQLPVLLAVIVFTLFGSSLLLALLDPFGVFGRVVTLAFKPALLLGGSLGSTFLQLFGYYPLVAQKTLLFVPLVFTVSVALFSLAGILSLFRGRLYCNTFCPVGTILGWISRHSFLAIRINGESCTQCLRCTRQCRSSCIDVANHRIDGARCTLCFDCIQACPEGAVSFSLSAKGADKTGPPDPSRRKFLGHLSFAAGSLTAAAAFTAFSSSTSSSLLPFPEEGPVTPPGSVGYRHLAALCSSCYACMSVCPTRVIRPALLEYGSRGLFKPVLDYSWGYCEYACTRCLEICPTGAIKPVTLTEKKRIQIGLSVLDIDKCIVKLKSEDCGACAEACPTRAVIMVEYEDGLFYPETRDNYCIGCGACEHACPARPLAITVTGRKLHKKASIVHVEVKQIEEVTDSSVTDDGEEEFPF